jgi:hypothetical protein
MKDYFYEPGNATRYHLVYGSIKGTTYHEYMVVWLKEGGSGGSAFRWRHFDDLTTPHWSYLSEKMGINIADAKAIAGFIEAHHPTRVARKGEHPDDI